jgi:protein disulfide-isomerase A1
MKIAYSLIFICLTLSAGIRCAEEEDKVLVLDDSTFDEELKKHSSLLVEFYAPWCGHCKSLTPEYAKAAEILRELEPPFYLAKVDATTSAELAQRFSIEGFPTIKLFLNGVWKDYDGGRTSNEIVQWIKKKLLPPSTELKSVEEIEKLKGDNVVSCIFFGNAISEQFTTYMKVANKFDDVIFGHVTNPEFFEKYGIEAKGGILLFKKFDEGKNIFDEIFNEEAVESFINTYSVPLVSKFDDRAADAIFGREKAGIFYIRSEAKDEQTKYDTIFSKLAGEYRGNLIFIVSDIITEIEEKLAEYYNIKEDNLPHVRITDVKGENDIYNYVLSGEITEESVRKFIADFKTGELKPYLKSEPVPTEQNDAVIQIVGSTFKEIVVNSKQHVLVEFYAPWCGHCKALAPIYEKVAQHFKNDTSIVIGKIDATANEFDGAAVEGYPTIRFYPSDEKNAPIEFVDERDFKSLVKFVDRLAHPEKYIDEVKVKDDVEKEDEKDDDEDHDDHDHDHHGHDHHGHDHSHEHHDHSHDDHDHSHSEEPKSEL